MSDEPRKFFGNTFENGELKTISASQIKTFAACPLKWRYEKVEKLPKKPPGKGVKLGTESHKRLELFLKGTTDVRNALERAGAELIAPFIEEAPRMGGKSIVEGALEDPILQYDGVTVGGFYDWYIPGEGDRIPVIIDHKFRKDVARYAEKPTELYTDPQAVIYSYWALLKQPEFDRVQFRHHNHQTEGQQLVKAVFCTFPLLETKNKFLSLCDRTITGMRKAAKADLKDVKYNQESCSAFGGCDFAATCPRSPQNSFMASLNVKKEGNMVSAVERMKASKEEVVSDMPIRAIVPPEPEEAAAPAIAPAAETAEPVEEQKKKGRPAKSKENSLPQPQLGGFILCVDCAVATPEGFVTSDGNIEVYKIAARLAAEAQLSDIRLAPKTHPFAYGAWKATLAIEALKNVPKGTVCIFTSELTEPVIEAWASKASMVIRGSVR